MRTSSRYRASLQLATGLSDEQRQSAEQKFREVLEYTFGGASAVCGAYVEWLVAQSVRTEHPEHPCTDEENMAIARWEQAADHATRAVFRQMNITNPEAFFELHVWNSRTQ